MHVAGELMSKLITEEISRLEQRNIDVIFDNKEFKMRSYQITLLNKILNDIFSKNDEDVDDYFEALLYQLYVKRALITDTDMLLIITSMISAVENLLLNFV